MYASGRWYLKEADPSNRVGGYVIKAGDAQIVNNYDDLMELLRLDYFDNPYSKTPSKKYIQILYKTDDTAEMKVPIGANDPWPCTSKGFLANTNGEILPEYTSPRAQVNTGEIYLVDGKTG